MIRDLDRRAAGLLAVGMYGKCSGYVLPRVATFGVKHLGSPDAGVLTAAILLP